MPRISTSLNFSDWPRAGRKHSFAGTQCVLANYQHDSWQRRKSLGSKGYEQPCENDSEQSAKSLKIRTAMSLWRWQQQGKKAEAHEMLAEIYNWFTEGFDTKDLQEAKALLRVGLTQQVRIQPETDGISNPCLLGRAVIEPPPR